MNIDDRINEIFVNADYNASILNIELDKDIHKNLFDYQVTHVQNLIGALQKNNIAIDTSDTGCGKTYCALAICKQLNLKPIIICPKSIMSNWNKLASHFKIKPLFICNYETMKKGKYYRDGNCYDRINCPYLVYKKKKKQYGWRNLKKNNIIIFDEVHFCKSKSSLNGKLLIASKEHKLLLLSATLIDEISSFEIFTYMLDWCDTLRKTTHYLIAETKSYTDFKYLSKKLYPDYGSRISIEALGDKFPKNNIIVDTYDDDENYNMIDDEYKKIRSFYKKLEQKEGKSANLLADISYSRQKIELYKLGIISDLVRQYLENKYSVVIFVNFTKSLMLLSEMLNTNCLIFGKQTYEERMKNIEDFQENKRRVIISNICAGGQSINLHDKYGNHPRVSLIVPSYSSIQLIQALGRIHRAGSKTPCTQRIIFCSGTMEEHIVKKLKEKINNLSSINDNDLGIF